LGDAAVKGQTIILRGIVQRELAKRLIDQAPDDALVNVRESTRTDEQNAKMWAMLSDIARAKPMGRVHKTDDWKSLFMDMCGFPAKWVPSLDGEGVVNLGHKSSHLTKSQFSDLIECIYAFGADHGVRWSEPKERKAA